MMIQPSTLAACACACTLVGCAVFKKAHVVVPPPPPAVPTEAVAVPAESVPKPTADDGLRTGDLLVMPRDTEYRATNPALPKTDTGAGTVIVNPPSAPKPKPAGKPED